jgi:hypothetical protein
VPLNLQPETLNLNPKLNRPHLRRQVYQFRCWFALASGYDQRSLGAEGKITWTDGANKSRVEKPLYRAVNFRTVATIFFLKKLGKLVLPV